MILKLYTILIFICSGFVAQAFNWQQKASFGGIGRHRATGISIGNKGYIGLGHVNGTGTDISYKDWWQFDPASNSWTQKANYPVNNHGAVAFSTDTKGYVGGGSALNNQFYEFDPQTNSWTAIANCPLSPGDVQVFSVQNKGYVFAGNQLAEYNPVTNGWTLKANAPISFNIWCSSFSTESSGFVKSGMQLYEYKPSIDQWIQRANFPGLMANGSAAFSIKQKGYFTCGYYSALSDVTDEVWEYNPGNNIWTLINAFPGNKRRFPVAFSINDKGYFGTGTNGTNLNDFWQLDLSVLDLEEMAQNTLQLQVYPNPAKESVHFILSESTISELQSLDLVLFKIDGTRVRNIKIQAKEFTMDRNDLPNGIYFYSIFDQNEIKLSGKLIYY